MSFRLKEVNKEVLLSKNSKDGDREKVPKSFVQKCNIKKVNMKVMREWIEGKLEEQLPDDDIVVDYVCEMLEGEDFPEINDICEQMKGFLGEKEAVEFCDQMWRLLVAAQDDMDGIPPALVEVRKKELEEKKRARDRHYSVPSRGRGQYNRSQYNSSKRGVQDSYQPRDGSYRDKGSRKGYRATSYSRDERTGGRPRNSYRADRREDQSLSSRDRSPQRS